MITYISDHLIYKNTRTPVINEELPTEMDPENPHEKHAMKVAKNNEVVRHILRKIIHGCSFSWSKHTMSSETSRENKRGNGMEVSYNHTVKRPKFMVTKVKLLIYDYLKKLPNEVLYFSPFISRH